MSLTWGCSLGSSTLIRGCPRSRGCSFPAALWSLQDLVSWSSLLLQRKLDGMFCFPILKLNNKLCFPDEFPLLTTKRVFWKGVLEELLWFIKVKKLLLLEINNLFSVQHQLDPFKSHTMSLLGLKPLMAPISLSRSQGPYHPVSALASARVPLTLPLPSWPPC